MAGAAHVRVAAGFDVLVGADFVRRGMRCGEVAALEGLAELVIEALGSEVTLLLADPLVQPEVGRYQKLAHLVLRCRRIVKISEKEAIGKRPVSARRIA